MVEWLDKTEAVRQAFKYRNRAPKDVLLCGHSDLCIKITDYDRSNLRIFDVRPGVWDDWRTWTVEERPMTDREATYLDWWQAKPDEPSRRMGYRCDDLFEVVGYIHRPSRGDWCVMLNVDQVSGNAGYE